MEWVEDIYTIVAGDILGSYAGRAWSAERKTFESVHNGELRPCRPAVRGLTLRGVDVRALHAANSIISGIRIMLMVVTDPLHPNQVMILQDGYQSSSKVVSWLGRTPMAGGVQWRIHTGGLIATDYVCIGIAYE
jgi:hypothetical protein